MRRHRLDLVAAAAMAVAGCGAPPAEAALDGARFSALTNVPVGRGPVDVAVGDLDGDRCPDLVTADSSDRQLSARLQRRGRFVAAPGRPMRLRVEPHLVALADLDRDGDLDVVATAHDDAAVAAWLNDGTGRFSAAPGSPFASLETAHPHNHGLAVGDFDGDRLPDIVTADQDAGSVSLLLGDGRGRLAPAPGSPFPVGRSPYPPAVVDWNRDGRLDLAVPLVGAGAVAILIGDGRGRLAQWRRSPIATRARPYSITPADLDRDRSQELLVAHDDTDRMTVVRPDGSTWSLGLGRRGWRFAAGDLDGDRDIDAVGGAGDELIFLAGDGRGGLRPRLEPALASLGESWSAAVADIDGNRRMDVIAPDRSSGLVRIWLGTGGSIPRCR